TSDTLKFVIDNEQSYYSVDLIMGSNNQELSVLLDTGSSDLWVLGATSDNVTAFEANCETFGVFTPSDSITFEKNHTDAEFFIQYGDGTFAEGYWGSDQLTINGVAVDGLLFGVANMSNSSNVLGISFPYLESSYQSSSSDSFTYSNLPQLLKDTGLIQKVVYSLFLNSLEASSGDLLFGALDTSKYTGSLYTIPLINIYSAYYSNPIEFDITLQGSGYVSSSGKTTTFSTQYLPALLDSGTTLLYLPTTLATIFASAVGAKWDTSLQYFTMSCPSTSTADNAAYVFQFGGINYYVPLANYILETSDSSICVLGIQPQSSQYCILGDNTLSALYIVYDLEDYEVAIAQANYAGATDSDIKEITSTIPGATSAPSYSSTWTATVSTITTGGDIF
ncbi:peptidase A1, partial [Hanseniaspora valbyensis NRRL Y-1626]